MKNSGITVTCEYYNTSELKPSGICRPGKPGVPEVLPCPNDMKRLAPVTTNDEINRLMKPSPQNNPRFIINKQMVSQLRGLFGYLPKEFRDDIYVIPSLHFLATEQTMLSSETATSIMNSLKPLCYGEYYDKPFICFIGYDDGEVYYTFNASIEGLCSLKSVIIKSLRVSKKYDWSSEELTGTVFDGSIALIKSICLAQYANLRLIDMNIKPEKAAALYSSLKSRKINHRNGLLIITEYLKSITNVVECEVRYKYNIWKGHYFNKVLVIPEIFTGFVAVYIYDVDVDQEKLIRLENNSGTADRYILTVDDTDFSPMYIELDDNIIANLSEYICMKYYKAFTESILMDENYTIDTPKNNSEDNADEESDPYSF